MLRRTSSSAPRLTAVTFAAVAVVLTLVSCAPTPEPRPTATESGPEATATPSGPVFLPDGTAEDNLPIFTATADSVWGTESRGAGRSYIDALTAAGFDRADMQVTQDASTVGNPAESLQFSVRWGEKECLIGQVGPSTGQVVTAVMPQLAEGRCLIGTTRPIDW
ncbi:DUF6993 domain-containing protein [Microbacterium oxydans]|uniref:DUF6993 domain-containing protein n=1 Tax=Microbacterium oxydans TaxID=82380 RepID=UPI001E316B40|nr:hypothetical protein [Microbacterium oxydans]